MEKGEIVDEMSHSFLTEQGYMVQADDIEGTPLDCDYFIMLFYVLNFR